MKVSKHTHSCLLIKEDNKTILIDPGIYSVEDKSMTIDLLSRLDYLLITHEHQDHMHIPFIKLLINKFPGVQIISNQSVVDILSKENIKVTVSDNEIVEAVNAPHEHVFGLPQFENTLFNVFSVLTHPGDNLSFDKSCRVLALPVQAPWGSLTQAVEKAIEVKPEYIIPIHDWHWHDNARSAFYTRLTDYFSEYDIKFLGLQNGEEITI